MKTFERAKLYMYRHARPVDLARFRFHFEQGSREDVLCALAAYQNADGGFGHAMEPDGWNPNSAPGQTCTAVGILQEIGMDDKDHPMVQGILRYLAGGDGFAGDHWESTIKSNDDYPCAPWWKTSSVSTSHHKYNMTVALCGFIIRFAEKESDLYKLAVRIAKEAADYLLSPDADCDMHVLCCYQQMILWCEQAKDTAFMDFPALKERLLVLMEKAICRETEKWPYIYTATPSTFLRERSHPLYPQIRDLTEHEVRSLIASQEEDGSWPVTWQWDAYPDEWAVSKVWWKCIQIIERLLFLRGMGALSVQSRCGILCDECRFTDCPGCINIPDPFWGHCTLKGCCEDKHLSHCGTCKECPCDTLNAFAYEENEGDDGRRIRQCQIWRDTL